MKYSDIIATILSMPNGAIDINGEWYQNIHSTVRKAYANVKATDPNAFECKAQMTRLLEAMQNPKIRLMAINTRKKK